MGAVRQGVGAPGAISDVVLYQIYVETAANNSRELDDWLQAEREVEGLALAHAS